MMTQTDHRSRFQIDRRMLAPKAFYFCFYAAGSALIPYLTLYYASTGLSGRYIGLLAGLPPLITLAAAPFWGGVADASQRHRRVLLTTIAGAIATVLVLSLASNLRQLLPLVAVYAFFSAPIISLVDNSVMAMLGPRKEQYGRQRVWGAIGWGVAASFMGILIERQGLHWSFYGYALFMGAGWLVARQMPVTASDSNGNYWLGLRTLMRQRSWVIFLVTIFSASIATGMMYNFLFIYMDELGATATLMGFSLVVATVSELPIFFYSDRLLARWGARGLLLMALTLLVVRMFAYAAIPAAWWVLPISLLHGLTFSAMWAAGVAHADALAPEGMGATAQGMFAGVIFGVGSATGALLGGFLYEGSGPVNMFNIAGLAALVGLALYGLAGRHVMPDA